MESQQIIIKELENELEKYKKYTASLKTQIAEEKSKLVILCKEKNHDFEKHENNSDYYHTYRYNVCKICNFTTKR